VPRAPCWILFITRTVNQGEYCASGLVHRAARSATFDRSPAPVLSGQMSKNSSSFSRCIYTHRLTYSALMI
jgi:hypothetical protein